jgi:hypothetical protein
MAANFFSSEGVFEVTSDRFRNLRKLALFRARSYSVFTGSGGTDREPGFLDVRGDLRDELLLAREGELVP